MALETMLLSGHTGVDPSRDGDENGGFGPCQRRGAVWSRPLQSLGLRSPSRSPWTLLAPSTGLPWPPRVCAGDLSSSASTRPSLTPEPAERLGRASFAMLAVRLLHTARPLEGALASPARRFCRVDG